MSRIIKSETVHVRTYVRPREILFVKKTRSVKEVQVQSSEK